MNKILITGGAGFIGSNLVDRLLDANNHITCIDNFDDFYPEKLKLSNIEAAGLKSNFQLLKLDIRDKDRLFGLFQKQKFDTVIHLAAKAGVRPSIINPTDYFSVNIMGTLNLLEAMRLHEVKRLIFGSSSSVYGNSSNYPFHESDRVDAPISPYAATKKAGELLCYNYHHLFGFDIFCLRFFSVYGPRIRPDLAIGKFADMILSGKPIEIFGDGSSSRDYTFVDDIVAGIVNAITRVEGYEIINLGDSKPVSLNRMVETLENQLGRKAIKVNKPPQKGDVMVTYADIEKAKQLLGYEPQWEFEAGIRKFLDWKFNK